MDLVNSPKKAAPVDKTPVDKARLQAMLTGKAKPANEKEALQATNALLWKKAFESALKPMGGEAEDPLAAPQASALRDHQALWMGIEAVSALGASIQAQLGHLSRSSGEAAPKSAP